VTLNTHLTNMLCNNLTRTQYSPEPQVTLGFPKLPLPQLPWLITTILTAGLP
jgi:hypothetical protein